MVIGEGLWEEGREGGREEGREKKIQGESRDIKLQFEETKFIARDSLDNNWARE